MKVLVLSPYPELLAPALDAAGDTYETYLDGPLETIDPTTFDWIVCFGHRKIIGQEAIGHFTDRIINIHLSFLPWCRGADPNFWSWFEDYPKGVSIHRIDAGIDTGNIIVQQHVTKWRGNDTLKSSYFYLIATAKQLFEDSWKNIRRDGLPTRAQGDHGSYHSSKDKNPWFSQLPLGWDTPVKEIKRLGREHRAAQHGKENRSPRPRKHRQPTLPEL